MALTFQTVFLTHAGHPVSDGLAMFQHARQHKKRAKLRMLEIPSTEGSDLFSALQAPHRQGAVT
jgi:hypothetical protein